MNALLRPGVLLALSLKNRIRHPVVGLLYVVPLGVSAWLQPEMLRSAAFPWLVALLAIALYYHASVIIGAADAWAIVNRIAAQLNQNDLRPIPDLDLDDAFIRQMMKGQFGFMLNTLRDTHRNLAEIVRQANDSAEAIAIASGEVAAGNASLSQRTEEQAATLEETASGMDQLAGSARQNAEGCTRASVLAKDAEESARQGAAAVHRAVQSMTLIDRGSRRMAEIMGVIEGIAFQTNILALNAAVEAARAGEQGRGFAVVASEVRSLAHRSAEAAKEIKALIEETTGQIAEGSDNAQAAGSGMDEIVAKVQGVSGIVREIAGASADQSASAEEISRAIQQLDSVTQQNAALVEQAAASALAFQDHADRLSGVVAQFTSDPQGRLEATVAGRRGAGALPSGRAVLTRGRAALSAPADDPPRPRLGPVGPGKGRT
jgi:methyl-accepting chemotaxis protein